MKKTFSKIIRFLIITGLCLTFSGCNLFQQSTFVPKLPNSNTVTHTVNFSTATPSTRQYLSTAQAVAKVERSVVAIKMTYVSGATEHSSFGSGVIIDNGNTEDNVFYVLTCHHVIRLGGKIDVYVPDTNARNFTDADYNEDFAFEGIIDTEARTGELTLIGGDQKSDIAVLKLDLSGTGVSKEQIAYSILPPENTESETVYQLMRGESVFAVGNPSGVLPMTVSAGIISYIDREALIGEVGYMNLLQIDVQTAHGSSGGGLFNNYGELIGITNAGSVTYDCINYAIPYYSSRGDGFVKIAEELVGTYYNVWQEKNHGYVSGNWSFGTTIASTSKTAKILSVVEGSNAYNAGIMAGDLVVGVSFQKPGAISYSEQIKSREDFEDSMFALKKYLVLGDKFAVTISRAGITHTIEVMLTEQLIFMDTGEKLPENNL